MVTPSLTDINTFMAVTGASEEVALRKLMEHDGDLNQAANAYFNERDGTSSHALHGLARNTILDVDDPISVCSDAAPCRPFSTAGISESCSFLLKSIQDILRGEGFAVSQSHEPHVSHPRHRREVPIESKDESSNPSAPIIEEITGSVVEYHPPTEGIVTIEDSDDIPESRATKDERVRNTSDSLCPAPGASHIDVITDIESEEELLKAAIEASTREASNHLKLVHISSMEDVELAHVSLQTAGRGRELHEQGMQTGPIGTCSPSKLYQEEHGSSVADFSGRQKFDCWHGGSSSRFRSDDNDAEDSEEQPATRHWNRQSPATLRFADDRGSMLHSTPSSALHDKHFSDRNGSIKELEGISSQEYEEALMLESAIYSVDPEKDTYQHAYRPQNTDGGHGGGHLFRPRCFLPFMEEQRLLKKQQDIENLQALIVDKEKELNVVEAQLHALEEAAARDAAHKKMLKDEEVERQFHSKQVSLPPEPSSDDENAIALLIKMPDGSRHVHRFMTSDKLQSVIDFIDTRRLVKPASYRLVRPYPRRAFGEAELGMTLADLGLAGKQEALFLELI